MTTSYDILIEREQYDVRLLPKKSGLKVSFFIKFYIFKDWGIVDYFL